MTALTCARFFACWSDFGLRDINVVEIVGFGASTSRADVCLRAESLGSTIALYNLPLRATDWQDTATPSEGATEAGEHEFWASARSWG